MPKAAPIESRDSGGQRTKLQKPDIFLEKRVAFSFA
jgi:hypothetical protein